MLGFFAVLNDSSLSRQNCSILHPKRVGQGTKTILMWVNVGVFSLKQLRITGQERRFSPQLHLKTRPNHLEKPGQRPLGGLSVSPQALPRLSIADH
jgi:hypothetical protein